MMRRTAFDEMTEKLRNLERVIQQEQEQPFVLFGLFKRTEGIGLWDLVVASHELEPGLDSTLYLSRKLHEALEDDELLQVATVRVLDPESAFVQDVIVTAPVGAGENPRYLSERKQYGPLEIEEAYLIRAARPTGEPSPA